MAEQRLPLVGGDDGTWGDILRQFLMKEHVNTDTDNAGNGGHQKITIKAGTTSAGTAPIKFTSGPLMTAAEAGAMEYNGDYFLTDAASRKRVATYDDSSGATGDMYYRHSSGYFTRLPRGNAGDFLTISGTTPAWTATIPNTATITLKDTNFTLQDDGDTSKQLQFQLSSISTSTTRTLTVPNTSGTIYVTGGTDVSVADGGTGRSTNTTAYGIIAAGTTATGAMQTIAPGTSGQFLKSAGASALGSFANITAADITGTTAQFNTALTDNDFATQAGAETLTNKTLTAPVLGGTSIIPQTGALELYNTSDQTTNYEKSVLRYNSNVLEVGHVYGGTAQSRVARFGVGASAGTLNRYIQVQGSTPFISYQWSGTLLTGQAVNIGGSGNSFLASSGTQIALGIDPNINQSGTAGYTALLVNPAETTTGSGSRLLADFQVGDVSKAKIDADGMLTAAGFNPLPEGTEMVNGTTTLTAASSRVQAFYGSSDQTVKLPSASIEAGTQFTVINQDSGTLTVQASDGTDIGSYGTGAATFTAGVSDPTTSWHWVANYVAPGAMLSVHNSVGIAGTDGTTMTFPSSSGTVVTTSASQTLTGKAINAANNTITGLPYDLSIMAFGLYTTRAVGAGDFPIGIKLQRACTLTSVTYRCSTADASGNLVVELRKNGATVSGSSATIAAASQVSGGTATGTWSFSAGDILTVYITGVGTTPGTGLVADIKGATA